MAAPRKAKAKRRKLTLDCDICGEPVVLSPERYVELVKAGQRPRCRKNGCERLCGAKNPRTARSSKVLATRGVALLRVDWPRTKRSSQQGALAKLAVSRDQNWRWEGCCHNG